MTITKIRNFQEMVNNIAPKAEDARLRVKGLRQVDKRSWILFAQYQFEDWSFVVEIEKLKLGVFMNQKRFMEYLEETGWKLDQSGDGFHMEA